MKSDTHQKSLSHYFFVMLLVCGTIVFLLSFFIGNQDITFGELREMGTGILLIGIGEWINHPLQKSFIVEDENITDIKKFKHRKRNPSSLGNLLEIAGLILVFTGLADFF